MVYSDARNKTTTLIDLTGDSFTSEVLLFHFGIQQPASTDYFPHEDRVYWSDILQGMILSVFTNGTSMKLLFSCDVIRPLGMVIDKAGRNLTGQIRELKESRWVEWMEPRGKCYLQMELTHR